MKKQSILMGLLIATSGLYAATGTEVLQKMVNGHTRAFGQGQLFKSALDTAVWEESLAQLKEFVLENSKDLVGRRDSTLTSALGTIEQANRDLLNNIKITRGTISSGKNLQPQINMFAQIEDKMKVLQRELKATNFTLSGKKNAQKSLIDAALFIETTAAKARKEIVGTSGNAAPPIPPRK